MYRVIHSRYESEFDSWKLRSRNFRIPGKRKPFSPDFAFLMADVLPPFDGGYPYNTKFCVAAGIFSNGVSRLNPCAYAASCIVRLSIADPEPGPRPPSKRGRVQSVITRAGSKSYFEPRPLQAGQAPYGELKLNDRGSSCGTEMPQSGQASFSEKTWSAPPTIETVTSPDASFSAVAIDCSSRAPIPGFTNNRSTTTSIV